MPFTKVFGTTSGSYTTATNWKPEDVTTPLWSWTASGSGTNEYYLRTAASGNPGFVAQPANVYINGSNATEGTAGSLAAGEWDYADNDTLGYSTIYVRLSAAPQDPDDRDPGYVKFYQIPQATEHVVFDADSASIDSATGLDQSGVAIGDFTVREGYQGTIGSATLGYLYIDPDSFNFAGSGKCFINIMAAAISPRVHKTGTPNAGERGLYLRGTAISVLDIMGGHVGLAVLPGETSTATTVRLLGTDSSLWLGSGASVTNAHSYAGAGIFRCAITTTIVYDGTVETEGTGAMTTVTQRGGTYIFGSTGTITTHNAYGGTFDEMQSGAARTITTRNLYNGSVTISRNKEAVTVTNLVENESYTMSISPNTGGGGGGGFL